MNVLCQSRTVAVVLTFGLVSCGGCEEPPVAANDSGPVVVEERPTLDKEPTGVTYDSAYSKASEEISAKNAEAELDALRKEIEKDRSE